MLIATLLIGLAVAASGGQQQVDQLSGECGGIKAQVIEYGYTAGRKLRQHESTGGTHAAEVWDIVFGRIHRTDRIPIHDGSVIYLAVELDNLPVKTPVTGLTAYYYHPAIKYADGSVRTRQSHDWGKVSFDTTRGERRLSWLFQRSSPEEWVAGHWRLQLRRGDCVLAEKSFNAYVPAP